MKKRLFILAGLATLASLAQGQQSVQPLALNLQPTRTAAEVYRSETWKLAVTGFYTPNTAIEPALPKEDLEAMAALGSLRDLLGNVPEGNQGAQIAANNAALAQLEAYITKARATPNGPSAMVLQIAGALCMQTADLQNGNRAMLTKAEGYLSDAIKAFPNFLRAHKNLAHIYFKTERPAKAAEEFVKCLTLGDNDPITYGLLGSIYFEAGQLISAESSLRNAMMLNPGIVEFKQLLGNVLLSQERWEEAASLFGQLLVEKPNRTEYWMAQANCYIGMDKIDKAAENIEIVRYLGKADPAMLMLLGDIYLNKSMVQDAAGAYMEAVEKDTRTNSFAQYIGAARYLNQYRAYDATMRLLDAIEKKMPQLDGPQKNQMLTLRSEVNLAQGKTTEAVRNLEDILKIDPVNGRALVVLARHYASEASRMQEGSEEQTLAKRETEQRAINYFERARALEDEGIRVDALVGEAQLLVRRREYPKAAELLEEAQSIRPQGYIQSYLDQINQQIRVARGSN